MGAEELRNATGPMLLGLVLLLNGCASDPQAGRYAQAHDSAPAHYVNVSHVQDAVPRQEAHSRYGNPASYVVRGKRYHTLSSSQGYRERGVASWYGTKFHGHRTSSGETYDMYRMSAAHKTLPLPTYAQVTNLNNGKSVVVKINDRGPFHDNRLIDLSYAAAARLDILGKGTGLVEVTAIDPAHWRTPAPTPAHEPKPRIAPSRPKVDKRAIVASVQPQPPLSEPSLYLQVGAFLDRSNAERLQSRLSGIQLPGTLQISESNTDNKPIYRVRVGPLASVEMADRLSGLLVEHGIHAPRVVID
jgi:rare lipoprotein A